MEENKITIKMIYNPLEEIQKEIKNAQKKGGRDVYAISSLLSLEKELEHTSDLLKKFKRSSIYKDRVLKSLNFFSKTVKKWNKEVSKRGNKAFSDRSEKQWYIDTKRDLKFLQKEAKRLKL